MVEFASVKCFPDLTAEQAVRKLLVFCCAQLPK
jgi:hypothetical protein